MSSHLTRDFFKSSQEILGKALEVLRQNYFIEAQMRKSDDTTMGGLNINPGGQQNSEVIGEKKRKEESFDAIFFALLEDMNERLAELEQSLARRYEMLQQKYGQDVVGGMVDTFLSESEKAGLITDKDKMEALARKFLNADGTIKEKYKDHEEAKYLRDWQEAQLLRPMVAAYSGRNDLTGTEKREVFMAVKSSSLKESKNLTALSENEEFKTTVSQVMDDHRSELASIQSDTIVTFGK